MRTVALLLALTLTGCAAPLQRFEFMRLCMGVQTRIVAYAPAKPRAESAAAAAYDRIDHLDAVMSDYRRQSELRTLLDGAGGPPVPVSAEFYDILATSHVINEASNGAFDITVAPAVQLWRASRQSGRLPDPEELQKALALIGPQHLILDAKLRTAQLTPKGARIDLGGIGKGYAAQRAVETLRAAGITRCLVALAGDIYVADAPPHEPGWRIEVRSGQNPEPAGVLFLSNSAVSTSGDTEQFVEIESRRYSHFIDPRTGLGSPVRRSATIVSSRGEWSDALATAVCLLGPEQSAPMLQRFAPIAAIIEERTASGVIRTIFDEARILRWSVAPAPAPR